MATDILMPALSPTMTEGTLSRWLKHEGDAVAPGDVLAEIETDKATMEVEAVDEGILAKILVSDGTEGVAVNTPIGILSVEGESVSSKPAPAPSPAPRSAQADTATVPPPAPKPTAAASHQNRIFASPLARRIAAERGIDLASLTGTGPNGRIVRADVEADRPATIAAPARPPAAKAPPPGKAPAENPDTRPEKNSGMRRAIARRLAESVRERPHFFVTMDVELDELHRLRAALNRKSPPDGKEGAYKVSINDMLIKAASLALKRVPGVAVTFTEDAILHHERIDISVAVAIPDGLITPILRDVDRKGLAAIANESRALFARARDGKLKPEEFQGGCFSISNLGMFGVREFTAIINPPQSAILAVGAGEKRAVVKAGELAIATVMTVTLSSDHRAIDGALAARWLSMFRQIVEDPLELML